jgi:chromosome segregation ATPase
MADADLPEIPEETEFNIDGDELPSFANAKNKELHAQVKQKEDRVRVLRGDIQENTDRIKVMTEHLTNVQHELISTQQLVDGKKKEVDTEEHMEALAKRQSGRLVAEMRRLKALVETYQDRTNGTQNQIFSGNEKLDRFKLQMNWNQEELEQWSIAARQKEEDELTLEKYKRADEAKIRELMLSQEQLTVENAKKKKGLETEVTETQAAQIEMDKTAEQFRQLHSDRKTLIHQWEEAVQNMQVRDKQLENKAQKYAEDLQRKRQKEQKLQEKRRYHEKTLQENEKVQQAIVETDRELARNRIQFVQVRDGLAEFQDEVEVLKNQLAAAAHEEVTMKNELVQSTQNLEDRKLRLQELQRKYAATERKYADEQMATKSAEEKADLADKFYQETELRLKQAEKTMKQVKDELYKQSQELYRFRQEEATTLGEISGAQSAIKNLQHQIQRLDVERQRQQELLYAVDFQSQSMQRKVARVSGERTLEEKEELAKKLEQAEQELEEKMSLWNILTAQHKKQDAELRSAKRTLVKVQEEEAKTKEDMNELVLQNEIMQRMMNSSTKEKEDVLVHHDVIKLEVSRLRTKLTNRTEQVFALENRKQQLSLSMQEREKEVEVHLDVLKAQHRVVGDERHTTAIELAERKQKIYSLKMKYEATVAKTKKTDDAEHSQAYYVLQAAQAKEELQRSGDELDSKIRKAEREIRALENTLAHLLTRNQKYKENFKKVDKQAEQQVLEKQQLDEQSRAANETLFRKKQQLANIDKELDEDSKRSEEIQRRQQQLLEQRRDALDAVQKMEQEGAELQENRERVEVERTQLEAQARSQGFLEPQEGLPKSLIEVDLGVRALKSNMSAILQSLAQGLEAQPRAQAMLRSVCEAKGLSIEADYQGMAEYA